MINSLRLQNFRSYKDASFEFDGGINIVVGANGAGKTNLLEAVQVLTRGKSFRLPLVKLARTGKSWSRLDGNFTDSTRTIKLTELGTDFTINNQKSRRMSPSLVLPIVLFEPNHLLLASGDPARRRDWLDGIIELVDYGMKKNLRSYQRVLAQRNRLLKTNHAIIKDQIFVWDLRLSELAGLIAAKRQEIINQINKSINKPYSHIAGRRQLVSLKYRAEFSPANYSTKLLAKLETSLSQDKERGFTGHGPHREDIEFFLNGKKLSETASRGETRSLLISLKIVEKNILEKATQTKPLLLLDDVFSELDGIRRRGLVDYLKDYQVILTTTDADAAIDNFGKESNLIAL